MLFFSPSTKHKWKVREGDSLKTSQRKEGEKRGDGHADAGQSRRGGQERETGRQLKKSTE
jgi:hypothetical protein